MQDKELNQENIPTLSRVVSEITEMHHKLNEWNKITADSENDLSQLKAIENEFRAAMASLKMQVANKNAKRELLSEELKREVKERKRIDEEYRKSIPRYKAYLAAASIIIIIAGATGIISQQYLFVPKVSFKPPEIVAPAVQDPVNSPVQLLEQPSQTPQTTQAIQPFVPETSKQIQSPPALAQTVMPGKQSAVHLISPPTENVPVVEKKKSRL